MGECDRQSTKRRPDGGWSGVRRDAGVFTLIPFFAIALCGLTLVVCASALGVRSLQIERAAIILVIPSLLLYGLAQAVLIGAHWKDRAARRASLEALFIRVAGTLVGAGILASAAAIAFRWT